MAQRIKRTLIVAGILLAALGGIYLVSFTTCRVPNTSATGNGAQQSSSVALIAKHARKDSLEVGDLLLVKMPAETGMTQAVCRIEAIHQPDESERMRAGGRRKRRIAQSILDMDFKPTYSVSWNLRSPTNKTNSASIRIGESQILGKVVWIFGDKT